MGPGGRGFCNQGLLSLQRQREQKSFVHIDLPTSLLSTKDRPWPWLNTESVVANPPPFSSGLGGGALHQWSEAVEP